MRAGRLRHWVTIKQRSADRNAMNEPVDTWTELASVHAEVRELSGGESAGRAGPEATGTLRVRIRYLSTVTALMRVYWGSRILEINNIVDPDGRKSERHLMCTELVA